LIDLHECCLLLKVVGFSLLSVFCCHLSALFVCRIFYFLRLVHHLWLAQSLIPYLLA